MKIILLFIIPLYFGCSEKSKKSESDQNVIQVEKKQKDKQINRE